MPSVVMDFIETFIFVPLIAAVSAWLIAFLRQQTIKLQDKIKDEKVKRLIDIAENVITQSVTAVSQTYVSALKKDGQFNKDEQVKAFEMSREKIYKLLTNDTIQTIQENYGDIEEWITTKIEETVNKNK